MELNELLKYYRKDFDDAVLKISQAYDKVLNENMELRAKNQELKDEHYKDEELAKLSNRLAEIRKNNDFILRGASAKKRDEFVVNHCDKCESYKKSGTYSYDFTKTHIDDMIYIRCSCGEECYLGAV